MRVKPVQSYFTPFYLRERSLKFPQEHIKSKSLKATGQVGSRDISIGTKVMLRGKHGTGTVTSIKKSIHHDTPIVIHVLWQDSSVGMYTPEELRII